MITEEKIKDIKRLIKSGMPEGELKEILRKEGYTKEDLQTAFRPHHYDMRAWYMTFGVIISLVGFYLFLKTGGLLILVLGVLLFVAYYYEVKRLKGLNKLK